MSLSIASCDKAVCILAITRTSSPMGNKANPLLIHPSMANKEAPTEVYFALPFVMNMPMTDATTLN
jgi:hypothetical protein